MQQKDLQASEGSWRGLQKLVKDSELGRDLKIKWSITPSRRAA